MSTQAPQPPARPNLLKALAATRFGGWFMVTIGSHIDRLLMGISGGRLGLPLGQAPFLVLYTVGAKTGQPRSTPLIYIPDGENLIVIASNGGNPRHPGWYYNLRARPETQVLLHGQQKTYIAREAQGAEREALWQKALTVYPGYNSYQQRAGRQIPVMVLTPKQT